MNKTHLELAVAGVRGLKPYQPGKPVSELEREHGVSGIVKLASNENPLGCSELAKQAIQAALREAARYPDGSGFELRNALAARHDIAPECITLGNGSNDVLDMIARVFLGPGSEAVFSQHAFAVYPIVVQAVGATACVAAAHDAEALAAGRGAELALVGRVEAERALRALEVRDAHAREQRAVLELLRRERDRHALDGRRDVALAEHLPEGLALLQQCLAFRATLFVCQSTQRAEELLFGSLEKGGHVKITVGKDGELELISEPVLKELEHLPEE